MRPDIYIFIEKIYEHIHVEDVKRHEPYAY